MTSNQAIVLSELSKPAHTALIKESAAQAVEDVEQGDESGNIAQVAVDWMVRPGAPGPETD